MRIAFFDSGFGGLSVLDAARRMQPAHHYLYYADSLHAPYGGKPAAQVRDLVFSAADTIAAQNPDALVIACNTATAVCIEDLRARYRFPVIGMEPAVKPALHAHEKKRVLVMATSLTLQESKLSELLERVDKNRRADKIAMDRLVDFAERGDFDVPRVADYLCEKLSHYRLNDYAAVVLGCTHFIYFKPLLQSLFAPGTGFVTGNEGTVRHLFGQLDALTTRPPSAQVDTPTQTDEPYMLPLEQASQFTDQQGLATACLGTIEFFRSGVASSVAELDPYFKQLALVHSLQTQ